jgi:hypothetical protein
MANLPLLWNRLELRTRSEQFDDNLRNTIHDPYWTLCRQWQTGEFEASDNGSPAEARVHWQQYPLEELSLAGNPPAPFTDQQPLEAKVERMIIEPGIPLRIEMGRHLKRLLSAALGASASAVISQLQNHAALRFKPTPQGDAEEQQQNAHLLSNRSLQTWIEAAVQTGALDGGALYKALKKGQKLSDFLSSAHALADAVGAEWVNWFDTQYNQPASDEDDAWLPQRLEYQFETSFKDDTNAPVKLGAEEYYEGHLDWYAFAYHGRGEGRGGQWGTRHLRHLLPAQVEYPGMPAARWWEIEDGQVNLLAVETSAAQSGRMALIEFGLMYSNDWFILPLRVPVGGLLEVAKIEIRDVFGQWSEIKHYKESMGNGDWSYFSIGGPTGRPVDERYLLLPPSVVGLKESTAIEEVYLARDEMANMVWGIEQHIPNGIDGPREGNVASLDLATYLQALSERLSGGTPPPPPLENEAKTQYTLATPVPEHWIPFTPVRIDEASSSIWLQRAAMPRVYPALKIERVRPRTSLLREGLDGDGWQPFYLFEEEVPRSGARVTRTWQRARWYQGRVSLWCGYHKQNGRGQGNSGLRFDVLGPKVST